MPEGSMAMWSRSDAVLERVIQEQTDACLAVYREDPSRVEQDANNELRIAEGGYGNRQLFELVQNAIDAARNDGGRIEVRLTADTLYVANDGEPFTEDGIRALMASDLSRKDDDRIGRFGIGFKSILAVSTNPKVISRSVSFEFNQTWATELLKEHGFASPHYPALRLAHVVDAAQQAEGDEVLRDMMAWAGTIVVVPIERGLERVSANLVSFPPQFVLFSPHITQASLINELLPSGSGEALSMTVSQSRGRDGVITLKQADTTSRWILASRVHQPTVRAQTDAGRIARRDEIEVQWAVECPTVGNDRIPGKDPSTYRRDGTFWAYFPTRARTTLSGFVNAPWKLSDDRLDLLEGEFNEEILREVVPELVADGMAQLSRWGAAHRDSAAVALDALPARGRETRSWADQVIGGQDPNPVFIRLRRALCVPDGEGAVRQPVHLRRAPVPLSTEWTAVWGSWLNHWFSIPGAPKTGWVHPDAYSTGERRLKLSRLVQDEATVAEWLEALVADGSAESSAAAIRLAAGMLSDLDRVRDLRESQSLRSEVQQARIIRLEDGSFARPASGKLFVRAGSDDGEHAFVDNALTAIDGVTHDLKVLGVHVMDDAGALRALLVESKKSDSHWVKIWEASRKVPQLAPQLFREHLPDPLQRSVSVKTASGVFRSIGDVFLAGDVVPAHERRDRDRLIDPSFHAVDTPLLVELGAVSRLEWRHDLPEEPWLREYVARWQVEFVTRMQDETGTKPAIDKISVRGTPPPWPLEPLLSMSVEARLEATRQIITHAYPEPWLVEHSTARNYPRLRARAPELSFVAKHGILPTSFGPLPPHKTVVTDVHVRADSSTLPIFETSDEVAEALGLITDLDDVPETVWLEWKQIADTWHDDVRRYEFYAWLPGKHRPETLIVRVGSRREAVVLENIGVTSDPAVYDSMLEAGVPAMLVEAREDVDEGFIGEWGMIDGKDLLDEEVIAELSGESTYLLDEFKPLETYIANPSDHNLQLQFCTRLVKMIATPQGQVARPLNSLRDGDRVLITDAEPMRALVQISQALELGLSATNIREIQDRMARTEVNELRRRVKRAKDDDLRLVEAVGVAALRRSVPRGALACVESDGHEAPPVEIARLARSAHGIGVLKHFRAVLDERGLEPPREWSGRRVSRDFVTSLGFPVEWAGFATSSRPATEVIDGPIQLPPLHDYQKFVTEQIMKLLAGIGKDRGMVSLPTGAGKTRVTVEALVKARREGRIKDAPLVWIAQSDELCEQAAESWTYVWRALGSSSVPMTLSRLWSGNEAVEAPSTFQVVIATIDKLLSITGRDASDYDWLRDPAVVVADEAHASIAMKYTSVLEWLGRGRSRKEFRPLIGLTATPFRGTSTGETERLVKRYDGNRLDRGAFYNADDPYGELQDQRVLARVRQELIDGVDVELTSAEIAEIEERRRLPNAVTDRLGSDRERTLRIVESIAGLPDDWTVLLFSTSVENAQVLAALLSHRGIPAVSISAETDAAARRYYIDQFKAGNIRVLTNYNVLTQGFDAPAVRAVYVTRPTFSPNVYQQMVGRGLRGPQNGGSEEVLIVNMQDNFNKFGDLLAYREFEYLWTR